MMEMHLVSHEPIAPIGSFDDITDNVLDSTISSTLEVKNESNESKKCAEMPSSFYRYPKIISKRYNNNNSNINNNVISSPLVNNNNNNNNIPCFIPPEDNFFNISLSQRASLVLSNITPPRRSINIPVSLHVYDLSNGLFNRRSEDMVGIHVSGVYHSALVCYGMEFFFEGGIAIAASGRTRFGKKYENILLGTTTKTLSEFLKWIHLREEESYPLSAYHPTKHNCHNFTRDAALFLVGRTDLIPDYLTSTINSLIKTKIGSAVEELLERFIRGVQYIISKTQKERVLERKECALLISKSSEACEIGTQPYPCVIIFRVNNARKSREAIEAIIPYAEQLVLRGVFTKNFISCLRYIVNIGEGVESIDPKVVSDYVEIVTRVLKNTHITLWGPILNGLRIAILHKSVLCSTVFHPMLLGILANAARDFLSMTSDGKLALLRVLCNLSSGVHGAIALNTSRFSEMWVSIIGLSLMEYKNNAIVYTGAALALNLTHAFVLTTHPTLSKHLSSLSMHHPSYRLMTVLLFYLHHWPQERIPEASMNMMLLSIFFFISSSRKALDLFFKNPFKLNYSDLIERAKTNDSKALLCIIHGLERLRCME